MVMLWVSSLCTPQSLLAQDSGNRPNSTKATSPASEAKLDEVLRLVQAQAEQIAQLQAELRRQAAQIEQLKATRSAAAPGTGGPSEVLTASSGTPTPAAAAQPAVANQVSSTGKPQEPTGAKLPEWLGRTTFSGTSYFRYSRELQAGMKDANGFEFDRIYFIVRSQLTDRVSLRFTMEGGEKRDGAGYFDIATKHLFIEVSKFGFDGSRLAAGLADLPWVPYEEGVWGYRFQGKVFADREGYLTSTDLGLGWKIDFPGKLGDFHFSAVNGEGWTKPEAGKYKDAHLRFTLTPIRSGWAKNIFFGAFGSLGNYDGVPAGEPSERQRVILQGGYRGRRVRLMTSFLWANDPASRMVARHPSLASRSGQLAHASGLSTFAVINFGLFSDRASKWEFIARHDRLDPDRDISNNEHQRWIFGGSYRWNKYVQTLFDYERVLVDSGSLRPFERRLMLQNEVRF
jgi:uncharacterized small protein (DUF1192 family)